MAGSLSVAVKVDTNELAKLAVAKAQWQDLSTAVRKAAREMADAGDQATTQMNQQLDQLVQKQATAGASVQAISSRIRSSFQEAGTGAEQLGRLGTEVTRLGHEMVSGEFYRAPATAIRLVTSLAEIGPVALASAAAIAAITGGLGLLAAREIEVDNAVRQAQGNMVVAGTAGANADKQIQGWIERQRDYWDTSTSEAAAAATALSKLHGPVAQYADGLLEIANKQAIVDRSSPSKNAEGWVASFNQSSSAALSYAEAQGILSGDQARTIKQLVEGKSEQLAFNAILAAANGQFGTVAEGLRKYNEQMREYNTLSQSIEGGVSPESLGVTLPRMPTFTSGTPTTDNLAPIKATIDEINSAELRRAALAEEIGNIESASLKLTGADATHAADAIRTLQIEYQKLKTPVEELAHSVTMANLDKQLEATRSSAAAQVGIYQQIAAAARAYYGAEAPEAIGADARVIAAKRAAASEMLRLTIGRIEGEQAAERTNIAAQIADQDRIVAATRIAVQQGIVGEAELEAAERRRADLVRQQVDQQNALQVDATMKFVAELDKQLDEGIKHYDALFKEHKITAEQQAAIETSLTQVILEEELKRLQAQQQTAGLTLAVQQDLANKIADIQQKLSADEIAITDKTNTEIVEQQRKLTNDLRQALQPVTSFFDSALSAMLTGSKNWTAQIEQAFAQMTAKILAEIAEMIAQWLVFQALTSIGGQFARALAGAVGNPFSSGSGGLGGVLGALFGGGSSGTITGFDAIGSLAAFAGGGIVTRPQLALVGEAGPEMIIPLDALSGGPALAGGSFGVPEMAMPQFGDGGLPTAQSLTNNMGGDFNLHGGITIVSPAPVQATTAPQTASAIMRAIAAEVRNSNNDIRQALANVR